MSRYQRQLDPGKMLLARLGVFGAMQSLWRNGWALVKPSYRAAVEQDRRMKMLYAQFIKPGNLCFDIGANLGSRTQTFLNLGARVVAIEPQKSCVEYLDARFGRNPKVHVVQKGLADATGEMTLHLSASSKGIATISSEFMDFGQQTYSERQYDQSYAISVTTFDALISEYGKPDFAKIDVEGSELLVLSGLTQPVASLLFEYTPGLSHIAAACVARLSELGNYQFNYTIRENHTFELERWANAAEMQQVISSDIARLDTGYGDIYARLVD